MFPALMAVPRSEGRAAGDKGALTQDSLRVCKDLAFARDAPGSVKVATAKTRHEATAS